MREASNAPLPSPQGEPQMICRNCGRQFRSGATFCPWCGMRTASPASSCGRTVALVALGAVALAAGAFGTCTTIFIVAFPFRPGGLAAAWHDGSLWLVVIPTLIVVACVWQMWRMLRGNRKSP